jgi:hypothetical protein
MGPSSKIAIVASWNMCGLYFIKASDDGKVDT